MTIPLNLTNYNQTYSIDYYLYKALDRNCPKCQVPLDFCTTTIDRSEDDYWEVVKCLKCGRTTLTDL